MLIKCPECGKEISDQAKACPFCGFPLEKLEKKENKEDTLVIARRGNRRMHTTVFILSGIVFAIALILIAIAIYALTQNIVFGAVASFVGSSGLIFVALCTSIKLAIWINKNARVAKDNIYYNSNNGEFIFIDIFGNEFKIHKDGSFLLRDNFRNLSELLLIYDGRKINLGFTVTPIREILNKVDRIKNG